MIEYDVVSVCCLNTSRKFSIKFYGNFILILNIFHRSHKNKMVCTIEGTYSKTYLSDGDGAYYTLELFLSTV